MTSTSWNFQQGGGVNVKCPLCGGVGGGGRVWIFLGTTQFSF